MQINDKLVKPITETSYLDQENSYRYRPIMRYFLEKHEQADNWLYKEDIYEELKDKIPDYTFEELERDLEFLVSKLSLQTIQDTENANTLEKFKYKNYRYMMTDYAIEIERMTIKLEEMEVKINSLEPRLFERIYNQIKAISNIDEITLPDLYGLWNDLQNDFNFLNQSYQDFLKIFQEPRSEDLLQSEIFIEHKRQFIEYLNNFIQEYLKFSGKIKIIFEKISEDDVNKIMEKLIEYQKSIPNLKKNFDFTKLYDNNYNKWKNLRKWFVPVGGISEGGRLLDATNNIIAKITRYANSLIELRGNMINRKEEYKYLCHLFDNVTDLNSAASLSSSVLGINEVRHFSGENRILSDSLMNAYDATPIIVNIEPISRSNIVKSERVGIVDKTLEKQRILEMAKEELEDKQTHLKKLVSGGIINLTGDIKLSSYERKYLLDLLNKSENNIGTDTIFGFNYEIEEADGICKIHSEDGTFILKGLVINLKRGESNA